jgi:hypothetical protein
VTGPPGLQRRRPAAMDADAARQLGHHAKAALMHLRRAEELAEAGGVDLDYVTANEPGAGPLFRAASEAAEDLDLWAINNAAANGAGRDTYDHTERWCHRPGGILPAADVHDVTAARMRALAGQAEALAAAIDAATQDFRPVAAAPRTRRAGRGSASTTPLGTPVRSPSRCRTPPPTWPA